MSDIRDPNIVYYGPHECDNCGAMIVKMGQQHGGAAFTMPESLIYPNTVWELHICDPANVKQQRELRGIPGM